MASASEPADEQARFFASTELKVCNPSARHTVSDRKSDGWRALHRFVPGSRQRASAGDATTGPGQAIKRASHWSYRHEENSTAAKSTTLLVLRLVGGFKEKVASGQPVRRPQSVVSFSRPCDIW